MILYEPKEISRYIATSIHIGFSAPSALEELSETKEGLQLLRSL